MFEIYLCMNKSAESKYFYDTLYAQWFYNYYSPNNMQI